MPLGSSWVTTRACKAIWNRPCCWPIAIRSGAAQEVLQRAAGRAGHIFNLGHGIVPQTPVENAQYLVEVVRELSEKR